MASTLIYLDTNIWNRLMDQNVDLQALLAALERKDATLALSGQTVYELSRTFLSSAPNASTRAKSCLCTSSVTSTWVFLVRMTT